MSVGDIQGYSRSWQETLPSSGGQESLSSLWKWHLSWDRISWARKWEVPPWGICLEGRKGVEGKWHELILMRLAGTTLKEPCHLDLTTSLRELKKISEQMIKTPEELTGQIQNQDQWFSFFQISGMKIKKKEKGSWLEQNGNSQAPYMGNHKLYVLHFNVNTFLPLEKKKSPQKGKGRLVCYRIKET